MIYERGTNISNINCSGFVVSMTLSRIASPAIPRSFGYLDFKV